ncbi:TPA: GH25 family lysozyme [Bacillus thuringiensis]|nr:N-acetylmuramoyl-L-alanine amidase [Bacillus cereus]HDR4799432.1 N-acetylmuramoyl-L-alanine amidase [Bacillus cereus]HDR4805569.1 N-acetylmuramoyl-L-alanine amidase [Bacillus cereus]HDR4811509.1 N-acetylmuramoyl-L-alanine amidase [Bacillus cereus]HDR4833982.1 N-acetylmuramoyl-L-alanine amidase [Bacillus cereus]
MSFGIDVSHWDGIIDWNKVKNDSQDIEFMIAKVTEGSEDGTNYIDPFFQQNINNANKVGILTGAYHFFRAVSIEDAKQEAAFFINNIKKVNLTAPVFIDVEVNDGRIDREELTAAVNTFLIELENANYKRHGVYSNRDFFENNLNPSQLRKTLWWIAAYNTSRVGIECDIWQYTANGKVQGIESEVDCNISYTDLSGNDDYIGIATITGDDVNLRNQPSLDGSVIRLLHHGESYKVYYEQNGWLNLGGNEFLYYDPTYIYYTNN